MLTRGIGRNGGKMVRRTLAVACLWLVAVVTFAQQEKSDSLETLETASDSLEASSDMPDSPVRAEDVILADSMVKVKPRRDWNTWKPDPKRAMWLGMVIPGAGQIYNRKYWKLPIVYGGFMGCIYAFRWNDQMYKDYAQAYLDIMDDDPNTHSYDQFLHLGAKITDANTERYKEIFKNRKDRYRRWRDLSGFVMIGIYVLSVIDAYVDASLSDFDISDDLSMSVAPTVMNSQTDRNPVRSSAVGLNCSLKF